MIRKALMFAALSMCLCLCGCSVLELKAEPVSDRPNLSLLSMEPYADESPAPSADAGGKTALRVDLWLGASRLMGGIRATDESIYPHSSKRYREGGFHYRYNNDVGMYEEVLRGMLATAEGSFTRIIRFGDERLPDRLIAEAGLADINDAEALRSVRRDMLTYAISPMPSIFSEFSAENMKDSYYSLGTPKLNAMPRLAETGGAGLENPDKLAGMSRLLDAQIAAIANGEARGLIASGDSDFPLLYALQSLDLTRLSVITFDPAELRRLSAASVAGGVERYLQGELDARGVFDKGLSVGLFALTLDYMGQMSSFGAADFAEPLIWGKLKFNSSKNKDVGALPMPRVMLVLVVGEREHVADYTAALAKRFEESAVLKGLRGPENGELEYQAEGRTIVQQPFVFDYRYAVIERPAIDRLTQHTEGFAIIPPDGSEVKPLNGLSTVMLSPDGGVIAVELPVKMPEGDIQLDLAALENAQVEVSDSLLLSSTMPNERDAEPPHGEGVQAIAVRDTVYVYKSLKNPFEGKAKESPFKLASLKPDADGTRLTARISADGALLKEGYYRLTLSADLSGRQVSWPDIGWIDGADSPDAAITNEKLNNWETFAALIHEHQKTVPSQFQHAWGPVSERSYHGMDYPDFPPVYRVPWLKELVSQLRASANVGSTAYLRCVFDVFVSGSASQQ